MLVKHLCSEFCCTEKKNKYRETLMNRYFRADEVRSWGLQIACTPISGPQVGLQGLRFQEPELRVSDWGIRTPSFFLFLPLSLSRARYLSLSLVLALSVPLSHLVGSRLRAGEDALNRGGQFLLSKVPL